VSDKTYRSLANDTDRASLLEDREAVVVPFSAEPVVQPEHVAAVRELLMARDLLTADRVLVRNPYDVSSYEYAEDAIETFASAKYHHLATIVSLLGGQSIKFLKVEIVQTKSELRGGFKFKAFANGDADFNRLVKSKLEGRFDGAIEFRGSEPDSDRARAFARDKRLENDPQVYALIEMCASGNTPLKYKMEVNGLRESTKNFKAGLAAATALQNQIQGGATFARAAEAIHSIKITTVIVWPREVARTL
jgi:hypothetical protein